MFLSSSSSNGVVGKEYDNSVERESFAALEKTRLLVSPEENGMLAESEKDEAENGQMPKRTASKYSICVNVDRAGLSLNANNVANIATEDPC